MVGQLNFTQQLLSVSCVQGSVLGPMGPCWKQWSPHPLPPPFTPPSQANRLSVHRAELLTTSSGLVADPLSLGLWARGPLLSGLGFFPNCYSC